MDANTPDGAVNAFLKALGSGDKDGAAKLVSKRAVVSTDLGRLGKGQLDGTAFTKFADTYGKLMVTKVPNATKRDERLIVIGPNQPQAQDSKKAQPGAKQVTVRNEDGGWKILSIK